jgi:hypothetical protein
VGTAQITQFSAAPTVLGRDLHDPPNGGSARGYHRDLCDGGSQHTCGVFAVDSIPAFLAVTTDPFVVYTSNVFGLLGMRALYFLLAGAAARFRFLRPRLAGHSGRAWPPSCSLRTSTSSLPRPRQPSSSPPSPFCAVYPRHQVSGNEYVGTPIRGQLLCMCRGWSRAKSSRARESRATRPLA